MTQGRWSSYAGDGSKGGDGGFVDKEDWAERQVPFLITDINERNGRFGQEWMITVQADEEESDTLSFKRGTGGRDEALEAARAGLQGGAVASIGPIILEKIRTKSGNPFFVLVEARAGSFEPMTVHDDDRSDLGF